MKNKLIVGLTLGAVMATAPLFAGCSSDITFNQSDLDNLVNNANVYLENQNNYDADYGKNVLNTYIVDGLFRNEMNQHHSIKMTTDINDGYNTLYTSTSEYKIYRDGNSIKEYSYYKDGLLDEIDINYREMTVENKMTTSSDDSESAVEGGYSHMTMSHMSNFYSGTAYREYIKHDSTNSVYSKKIIDASSVDDLDSMGLMYSFNLNNIYDSMFGSIYSSNNLLIDASADEVIFSDVTMEKVGDSESFKFIRTYNYGEGLEILCNYEIICTNGVIEKYIVQCSAEGLIQKLTFEINEDITDFAFDKTPYASISAE